MIGRGRDLSVPRDEISFEVRSAAVERLDHYLFRTLEWKSRTRIQRLITDGFVTVNAAATKSSRKVRPGDVITLQLSRGEGLPEDFDRIHLDFLFEDPWLVVVDKPPGLLVHPVGKHVYDTLMNYLHHHYQGVSTGGGERLVPRLCHRLDRETTGALVVGKDAYVHQRVQIQFEKRQISKEYYALVEGVFPGESASIELPIGAGRSLSECLESATLRPSRTGVRVVERFDAHTLLACAPFTGRQNQIRIHLAARGFPLAGDGRYGASAPRADFPGRYLLHSRRIEFYHPRWKSVVRVEAPLPPDFIAVLEALRAGEDAAPSAD